MIKILIVDDTTEKANILIDFLVEECLISKSAIVHKLNVKEARKAVYEASFDLLILDLVLPIDSESEPLAEESIKFLNEIYYNSEIHIPVHIIGFSQYDDLIETHADSFDDKLWHLIHFSYKNSNWKDKLRSKVSYLVSVKNRFKETVEQLNKFDICILCALENPELIEILDLPLNWKNFETDNSSLIFHEGRISTLYGNTYRILACSINRMGMHASATVASMIIAKFDVDYLFMTGICAGVKERGLNFGDIIIAENAIDYGSGKMEEDENGNFIFKPEPHQIPTDQSLVAKIQNFVNNKNEILKIQTGYKGSKSIHLLKATMGPVASGSYVVASKSFMSSIEDKNRKLLGVDMEAYGIYLASHFLNKTKVLLIKSVCDYGDQHKEDGTQAYAAFTSARFLHSFILNMF
jgi:nucleoside phosphorylase/CheY-like chemotaxis protein